MAIKKRVEVAKKTNNKLKKDDIICFQCSFPIDNKKEKYVLVGTYNGEVTMDESYFHFKCWLDHFNKAIVKRIQIGQERALNTLFGTFEKVLRVKNV